MQYPTFPHTPYVYPTPMHSTYMPHHYYAMPMPDSQPTPPPLFASDAHPPSAHVTLFGAGTSFQSPISSESPFDTLAYRNFSDLESDSAFGGGGSGSGSSFDDTTPPTAALGTSSPFAEYISMVDEGYFPVWE